MGQVVSLHAQKAPGVTLSGAVEEFLAAGVADGVLTGETPDVYRLTFNELEAALPAEVALVDVERQDLVEHLRARYGGLAPATYNRNLAAIASLLSWCVDTELLVSSPAKGIRRRKEKTTVQSEAQQRPIPYSVLDELWSDRRHRLRDRVLWAMAYDTAARAQELLGLNIENIDQANREAIIIAKGGNAERIYWTSTTARILPRLIGGRRRGPLFVGERKPRANVAPAAQDLCEVTGRARLSYRRAEEIFKTASGGKTLHQLRHSQITHLAEAGEDATMIKAKSRHRSLRSLERYVNPGPEAIRALTNRHDPNRR